MNGQYDPKYLSSVTDLEPLERVRKVPYYLTDRFPGADTEALCNPHLYVRDHTAPAVNGEPYACRVWYGLDW